MTTVLELPILLQQIEDDRTIGGPATIKDTISRVKDFLKPHLGSSIHVLKLDESTLDLCMSSAISLLKHLHEMSHTEMNDTPKLRTDSFTIQLGVSTNGKVGFIGSGMDIQTVTTFQLTFKVS